MLATRLVLATAVSGWHLMTAAATDYRAPSISSASLVNSATGQQVLAPYTICTIYGTDLFLNGAGSATGRAEAPSSLGGVTVLFGSIFSGLFYVSANQINLLIPNSLTPGTYSVTVVRDGLASQSVPVVIQEVAPGLFSAIPGFAVATHADGSPVTETAPASPGEVVIFYATGLGRTQPDPSDRATAPSAAPIVHLADFQVLLDGTAIDPSAVQYAGVAPFNAGLYQVNVRLPDDLAATNPEVRLGVAGTQSPPELRLITGPIAARSP
jgi:uncharacterized protein (TIGR03437 family)